jgi:hypothetical protein
MEFTMCLYEFIDSSVLHAESLEEVNFCQKNTIGNMQHNLSLVGGECNTKTELLYFKVNNKSMCLIELVIIKHAQGALNDTYVGFRLQ